MRLVRVGGMGWRRRYTAPCIILSSLHHIWYIAPCIVFKRCSLDGTGKHRAARMLAAPLCWTHGSHGTRGLH